MTFWTSGFADNGNLIMQIAKEQFSEATVGYAENKSIADEWVRLFNTNYFLVSAVRTSNIIALVNLIFLDI